VPVVGEGCAPVEFWGVCPLKGNVLVALEGAPDGGFGACPKKRSACLLSGMVRSSGILGGLSLKGECAGRPGRVRPTEVLGPVPKKGSACLLSGRVRSSGILGSLSLKGNVLVAREGCAPTEGFGVCPPKKGACCLRKRLDQQGARRFSINFMAKPEDLWKLMQMRTLKLPSGRVVPILGQGTWRLAENSGKRSSEIRAIQLGIDLGLTLIDTAEMYAGGESEELVGEAIAGRREELFLVSKVYPHNATRTGVLAACERSLRRLKTDRLDLYLLHWRGSVPLAETVQGFKSLKEAGKIRDYGVSNFDVEDMEEAMNHAGGAELATNQVLYNLMRRGIEWDLLPWCRQRAIPIMAYSPIEQGRLSAKLEPLAMRRGVSPAQIALAWLLGEGDVVAIPKASDARHVRDNRAALDLHLTDNEMVELDQMFPPPRAKKTLEMY
jgi:diketogulonate reductase-like aldo/keto reductase